MRQVRQGRAGQEAAGHQPVTLDGVPALSAQSQVPQHRERKAHGLSQRQQPRQKLRRFECLGGATFVEQPTGLDARHQFVICADTVPCSSGQDLDGMALGAQGTYTLAYEDPRAVVGRTWIRRCDNPNHGGGGSGKARDLGPSTRRWIPRMTRAQMPRRTRRKRGATTRGMRIPECQSAPYTGRTGTSSTRAP